MMFKLSLLLLLYLFVTVKPVHAYLDAGTGSYITQVAVGFLIGGGYLLKVYWRKMITFLRSLFNHKNAEEKKS